MGAPKEECKPPLGSAVRCVATSHSWPILVGYTAICDKLQSFLLMLQVDLESSISTFVDSCPGVWLHVRRISRSNRNQQYPNMVKIHKDPTYSDFDFEHGCYAGCIVDLPSSGRGDEPTASLAPGQRMPATKRGTTRGWLHWANLCRSL